MQPEKLHRVAMKRGLRGVAVTDHNTINGGIYTHKERRSNDVFVIVGSEIKTECGDLIGLFLNDEVKSRDALSVVDEIRAQDGLIVLPHPFRGTILPHHSLEERPLLDELFERIDLFEVLSGRQSKANNLKAKRLATRLGKPMIAGSDAHVYREVGDVQTVFDCVDSEDELRLKLLSGQATVRQEAFIFSGNLHLYVLTGLYGKIRRVFSGQCF